MDDMFSPSDRVSVVLCTHNCSTSLAEQLESILHQTHLFFELIIQDDNSEDGTVEILNSYAQRYPFIHLYLNKIEKGKNANYISALAKVKGDYIAIAFEGDIWKNTKLEELVRCIGSYWLCFHPIISHFGKKPTIQNSLEFDVRVPNYGLERLVMCNLISGSAMLIRKDLIEKIFRIPKVILDQLVVEFSFDSVIAITAAAFERIKYCDIPLSFHRLSQNDMKKAEYRNPFRYDDHLLKYIFNVFSEIRLFHEVKPQVMQRLSYAKILLNQYSNSPYISETMRFIDCYTSHRYLRAARMCIEHRDQLFYYPEPNRFAAVVRAMLFPITCCEYFVAPLN